MVELSNKDRAMRDALIKTVEKYSRDQKCDVLGTKCGDWENPDGTVIEFNISHEVGTNWYQIHVFKSIEAYEIYIDDPDKKALADLIKYGCGVLPSHAMEDIPAYFIDCMLKYGTGIETISNPSDHIKVRMANVYYKNTFTKIYDNWEGEDNNKDHREIIALIGSTRFQDSFLDVCWDLSAKGYVVTLPNFRPANKMAKGFDIPEDLLEDIGFKRIDMADKVFVINEDGYIGSSTRKEIEYAESLGKNIRYMEAIDGNN